MRVLHWATIVATALAALLFLPQEGNAREALDYERGAAERGPYMGNAASAVGPMGPSSLRSSEAEGRFVQVEWAAMDRLEAGQPSTITLPHPSGGAFDVVLLHGEYRGERNYSWVGQIDGNPRSDVILVRYEDVLRVEIRDYENGDLVRVRWGGGPHAVTLQLPGEGSVDGPLCEVADAVGARQDPRVPPRRDLAPATHVSDPTLQVDVMVIASSQALSFLGSTNAFVAEAQIAVDDFNNRVLNSYRYNLVRLRLVAADAALASGYSESPPAGDNSGEEFVSAGEIDLDRMLSGDNGFEDLDSMRRFYRADLVALMRKNPWASSVGGNNTVGGVAFRPSPESLNNPVINTRYYGFSVNSLDHASLSFVGAIFAHELGHNFSLAHDLAQYWLDQGSFLLPPLENRHGHNEVCELGCIVADYHEHTTMAYGKSNNCQPSVLIPFFSTPEKVFNAGQACPDYNPGEMGISFAAWILESEGAPALSQYEIAATSYWVSQGSSGTAGTFFEPRGSIADALNAVQGGVDEAVVNVKPGVYDESFGAGGVAVFDQSARIQAYDGVVVIE